ncbi:hypothetical protein [Deinococcus roseus]|uniref:Uncharacterized protein n=1 Tax=Deinococcus roseus TaxID=392414 RepID=A0ABQ2DF98_9DEIO|nr:hypothetical protein [Deinococcus roseus]GGJ55696.1 hypothetical protein GCM10008938_47350 [Deinococcus roseus]
MLTLAETLIFTPAPSRTETYQMFRDATDAWLEVPRKHLAELDLLKELSNKCHQYQSKVYVFWDVDLADFMQKAQAAAWTVLYETTQEKHPSHIRSMDIFQPLPEAPLHTDPFHYLSGTYRYLYKPTGAVGFTTIRTRDYAGLMHWHNFENPFWHYQLVSYDLQPLPEDPGQIWIHGYSRHT